ncbi:MAG: CpsD/CapB family tyrosine-protein kinase [Pseudomonadota bacterium]
MDFIKQIFDDGIDNSRDTDRRTIGFEKQSGERTISSPIAHVELHASHLQQNRIVAHKKSDPRTAAYDMLRTRLLREMHMRDWKTLAITSPTAESGKTLTSINLALSISHSTTNSATLVDFDLRRPTIAKYLGLPTDLRSVAECFDGNARISDVMVSPGFPNFVVLPNFFPIQNAAETLASDRTDRIIEELADQHPDEIVILDLPPILEVDDTLSVLPKVDCVLLVVAAGQSTANQIKECRRLLKPYNLIGTVLNKSDAKSNQYDYY